MANMDRTREYKLTLCSSKIMASAHESLKFNKSWGTDKTFAECLRRAYVSAKQLPFKYCKEDFYGNKDYHIPGGLAAFKEKKKAVQARWKAERASK